MTEDELFATGLAIRREVLGAEGAAPSPEE